MSIRCWYGFQEQTWLKAFLPLHTILFHNSMSFEFGYGYTIVHELVSFLHFREFDNHFSVQKIRFSLSHLLQGRLWALCFARHIEKSIFMNAKKEQHFSAIWPAFSALTGSIICVKMHKQFFNCRSGIQNRQHKCSKHGDMNFKRAWLT